MRSGTVFLAAVVQLPDADCFETAMTILDRTSPAAMDEDEILAEALPRQDGMESGAIPSISDEELVRGPARRPSL